jgi:DNA gyrase subunit B
LTFFFRQMTQLIANGRVYSAQPPLFGIKRGKRVEYISTIEQRNDVLLRMGIEKTTVEIAGRPALIERDDLERLLRPLTRLELLRASLKRKGVDFEEYLRQEDNGLYPEWRVRAGNREMFFFLEDDAEKFRDEAESAAMAKMTAESAAEEPHKRRAETAAEGEEIEGVENAALAAAEQEKAAEKLTAAGLGVVLQHLSEATGLSDAFGELQLSGFARNDYLAAGGADAGYRFKIHAGTSEFAVNSLAEVLEKVRELGKHGIEVTRYKGLGEMNAEQLWETTMNPEKRTLLRIRLEDAYKADEMFTVLMGDEVSTRREFIEQHALEITDLDI